jgi:DNA-binding beta-propeller fold protein YncE
MEKRRSPMWLIATLGITVLYACGESDSEDKPTDGDDTNKGDGGELGERLFTLDGFAKPESALFDPEASTIYVANINGSADAEDGNGFISKVSLDGEMLELKWIDGEKAGVTLNAPKGMGIAGDELFVADITAVRVFDRESGAPVASININGATFLNDVASDGTRVFVSDSSASVIYEIMSDRTATARVSAEQVEKPNGLAFDSNTLYAATGAGHIIAFDDAFQPMNTIDTGVTSLDGLICLQDGWFLVSSWGAKAVFVASENTPFQPMIEAVSSPADIGYVPDRYMVLIPTFDQNTLIGASIGLQ